MLKTPAVTHQCLHHAQRPAVARCPACAQAFCRECVVEHEGRRLCAGCLATVLRGLAGAPSGAWGAGAAAVGQIVLAMLVAGASFYAAGRVLRMIPADVHEGRIWSKSSAETARAHLGQ
jgi:stage V sporulation protein SpoVS